MDVRISKTFTVATGLHLDNKFMVNIYNFNVSMIVYTDNMHEQNVAIARMDYFIEQCLEDSVIVSSNDIEAIQKYQNAGIKICMSPEEPYDQIVAMILLQKLNAIMEGKLHITDIDFGSAITSGIRFQLTIEMAEALVSAKGWWNKPDISTVDVLKSKDNIVKLFDPKPWEKMELGWKEKVDKDTE